MTPVKEFQNTRFIQSNQHCRVNVSFFFGNTGYSKCYDNYSISCDIYSKSYNV